MEKTDLSEHGIYLGAPIDKSRVHYDWKKIHQEDREIEVYFIERVIAVDTEGNFYTFTTCK